MRFCEERVPVTGRARWRGKGPGTVDRKSLPGRLCHTFVFRLFVVGCPCAFPLGMGTSGPMSGRLRLRTGSPVGVCRARQRLVVRRFGRSECGTFGKGRPAQGKAVRRNGRPIVSIGFGGLLCGTLRAVWFHTDPARFAAPPFFGTKREERLPGVFPVSLRFRCTEPVERWSGVCRGAGNADRRMGSKSCVGPIRRGHIESRYRGAVSLGSRSGFGRIVGQRGRRSNRKSGGCGSRNRFSRYAVSSAGICNGVNGV